MGLKCAFLALDAPESCTMGLLIIFKCHIKNTCLCKSLNLHITLYEDRVCCRCFTVCLPFCPRKERREQGLTVVVDSRRQQPAPALLSSMSELQVSQARKICDYPPTHTHRGFSGPAKSPLSSEPPNSMFLPVYYTVAFLAPFLLFDQPALLTQIFQKAVLLSLQ